MSRFLYQSGLFFLSLLLLYYVMSVLASKVTMEPPENDFMAAMIDKHQRANEIEVPQILIAGGSNIAFNIESGEVQDELGIPVVNLGLNIGLGISYLTNELEDVVNEGDIILFFPTWFTATEGTYPLQKHTAKHYPRSSKYFNYDVTEEINIHLENTRTQIRNIIVTLILKGEFRTVPAETPRLEGMYTTEFFNKFGDFEGHHYLSPPEDLGQRLIYDYRYWESIPELNDFYARMSQKGVYMFFFYPAYPVTEWERNKVALEKLITDIEKDLNIPKPIGPKAFLFPENYFFDTVFHLTEEGKKVRTEKLIEQLKENNTFMDVIQRTKNHNPE